jgi:hypothetical protein
VNSQHASNRVLHQFGLKLKRLKYLLFVQSNQLIRSRNIVHRKKDFLKIQEYIHEGANLKLYIPEVLNFKLYIPEYSPI